jgi:hypothetical protein
MGEGERARSETEENDVRGWAQENSGSAASKVGEGEEGGVDYRGPGRWMQAAPGTTRRFPN